MEWKLDGFTIREYGRGVIAICPLPHEGGTYDVQENARLIAAAPDLLKACKAKLAAFEGKEYDPEAFEHAADLCMKAIAKAQEIKPKKMRKRVTK